MILIPISSTMFSLFVLLATSTAVAAAATAGEQAFAQSSVINHGIAGDWDADSDCVEVIDLMASKGVKTVIGQGDYGYEDSASKWWNHCFFDKGKPRLGTGFSMWGAIGNHDPRSEYVKKFGMDSAVTKRIVDKHYQIFMNTEESYSVGSSQYDKVVDMLKDAKQQKTEGNVNWISVSFHQPVYSSTSGHPPLTDLRKIYQSLWEQGDVDFVFQGHNHNYERTYPLTWSVSNYQICSTETTDYVDLDDKDCIIFFTVGTGGRSGYSLSSTIPNYIVTSERTKPYGYLNMGIDNVNGIVRFQMFKTDGHTISDFTVKRTLDSTGPTPTPTPLPQPFAFDKAKALNFIKSMYDPSDGMVKECPSCTKKWLWSDQLVAQIALKHIDPEMANAIESKMNSFNIPMRNPWATLDPDYRDKFSVGGTTERQVGSSNVWYSDYSGSDLSCTRYADVAFIKAIHLFYTGNNAGAKACYDAGKAMWDGLGMKDAGQITGEYAVYKTALGLLAQKITGFSSIGIPADYFDRFQAGNGGVTTDLTGGQPQGSQNVETTFAVLAALYPSILSPPSDSAPPSPDSSPSPIPNPTPTPDPISGCSESRIKVGANDYYDDTFPRNTVDKNYNTRWSNYGVGSYIQIELEPNETVCAIDIAWHRGDVRTSDFTVSSSNDGFNFVNVFSSKSSGKTNLYERYIIQNSDLQAKYLRITVNGNTENSWAAITEVRILSKPSTTGPSPDSSPSPIPNPAPATEPISGCSESKITVGANDYYDGTFPRNTVDKNYNTRWSNYGVGSFIQIELEPNETVCAIDIAWHRGDVRTSDFTVSSSNDGFNFVNVFSSKSSGKTNLFDRHLVPEPGLQAKYLRITVNGNTENSWAAITEVRILSKS